MSEIKKTYYYAIIKYMDNDGIEYSNVIGPSDNALFIEQEVRKTIDIVNSNNNHIYKIYYEKVCELTY